QNGGGEGNRTHDPLRAKQVLAQLSYTPTYLGQTPSISGRASFRGVTGGVYKARERIHPGMLIRDY
ncbi:hypothetical protein ADUPG1_002746, partial [Aduncisulcus paluster]